MIGTLVAPSAKFEIVTVSSSAPTVVWDGDDPKIGIQVLALDANTGLIYLGNSDVNATTKNYPLAAGKSVFLPIDRCSGLRALASVNGEKISVVVI